MTTKKERAPGQAPEQASQGDARGMPGVPPDFSVPRQADQPIGGATGPQNPSTGLSGADTEDRNDDTMPVSGGTADPGPPPARPMYTGDDGGNPPVDQLLLAMEAEDIDAARAVNVRTYPPAVVQFKAAVIEWIDAMDNFRNVERMPMGQPIPDPSEDTRKQQELQEQERQQREQQQRNDLEARKREGA